MALLVREGDRGARNQMVEANVALVAHVARRLRPPDSPIPHVDLVQEGVLGLMQAVERFDPDRGHRFSTYAMWWIRGAILGALRGAPPTSSLTGDDGLEDDLPAEEHDPLEDVTRAGLRDGVPELLDTLPDHGRQASSRCATAWTATTDHSVAETARVLGTSQARVRRIEEHALARLRAHPGTRDLIAA